MKIIRWRKPHLPEAGALMQTLQKRGLRPYRQTDPAGAFYPEHTHPHDEIRWMVRGRLRLGAGGKVTVLEPGDRLELPANTPHWAEVVGEEEAHYVCAST
jgi:mannose-6-phosphate isomerase-like protein (cupin superfamily)